MHELVVDEEFTAEIADKFIDEFGLDEARRRIEERFEKDRALSWRKVLEASLEEVREGHANAFKAAVQEKLRERRAGE